MPSSACNRSSLVDIPLWRVEADSSGREVRMVQLPFEQTSYDLVTHAVVRKVMDRNQDGISDRIVTYQGLGGARSEETDTDFDGVVDRWDTFAADGRRIRSAAAGRGATPDRIATYDSTGKLRQVEIASNSDGRIDLVRTYEGSRLAENRIDSNGNGRTDRIQDFRKGYLSIEDFDTDEDGRPNLRMTYAADGTLLKSEVFDVGRPRQGPSAR